MAAPASTPRQGSASSDTKAGGLSDAHPLRFLGFDVGGTNIRAEVLDGSGRSLSPSGELSGTLRTRTPASAVRLLDIVAEVTAAVEDSLDCLIQGVGVGCAGLIDQSGAVLTSPNIACLDGFPLAAALSEKLRRPVIVDNDAATAAVAEMQEGCLQGVGEGVYVTVGTGIGAALISGGQIRKGAHNLAGEVGHTTLLASETPAADGLPCPCGGRGCWEGLASGSALGRMARLRAETQGAAFLPGAGVPPKEIEGSLVTELAASGDASAKELLKEFLSLLAVGINNLAVVLDPQVVGLGGGLLADPLSGDLVLSMLRNALAEQSSYPSKRPPVELRRAVLGDRAGAIGAALLAARLPASPEPSEQSPRPEPAAASNRPRDGYSSPSSEPTPPPEPAETSDPSPPPFPAPVPHSRKTSGVA